MLTHSKGKAFSLSSWGERSSYYFTKYNACRGGNVHDQLGERIGDVSTALKAAGGAVGRVVRGPIPGQHQGQPLPHTCWQQ